MAEHIGIVIKTELGGYARIVTDRKSACGGCQSTPSGCRGCLASAKMESRAANPVNAEAGDLVRLQLSSGSLLTGAAILYLLPVFGLLFGAATGVLASPAFDWSEISASMGGAIIGLVSGYAIVVALDRNPNIRRFVMPTITAIVKQNVGTPADKTTSCGRSSGHV
jgi:sigma-E factor negative regulatory protein RseC